jgi:hypothetical protein
VQQAPSIENNSISIYVSVDLFGGLEVPYAHTFQVYKSILQQMTASDGLPNESTFG